VRLRWAAAAPVSSYSMGEHRGWLRLKVFDEELLGGRSSPQRGLGGNSGSKSGVGSGSPVAGADMRLPGWVGLPFEALEWRKPQRESLRVMGKKIFGAVTLAAIWPLPLSSGATRWTNGGGGVRGSRSEPIVRTSSCRENFEEGGAPVASLSR
jgi:hypothetical protein